MAALAGEPFQGNTVVRVTNGTGTLHYRLSVLINSGDASNTGADVDLGAVDESNWTAQPGDELVSSLGTPYGQVTLTWDTTGSLAPAQAYQAVIRAFLPGEVSSPVGPAVTVGISGASGSVTVPFYFDDDPFDGGGTGVPHAGMVEWYLEISNAGGGAGNWGPANSRGGFTDPGGRSHDWARGYVRAPVKLSSHSISNVSVGGAEPATFAYPDLLYGEVTLAHPLYNDMVHDLATYQGGALVKKQGGENVDDVITFDGAGVVTSNKIIDLDYAVGNVDLRVVLHDTEWSFNNDYQNVFDTSGHEAGWSVISEIELQNDDRFAVDPSVTFENVTLDNLASTVYNRADDIGGSFEIHNSRGEPVSPANETVQIMRDSDQSFEEAVSNKSRTGDVVTWDHTFLTSGNVAPADDVGDAKILRWLDAGSNINMSAYSGIVGYLSSLYLVAPHLQVNDDVLDPALNVTQRFNSDLGFYSVKISNQQGDGIDGLSLTDHLRDDNDLVDEISRTDSTATINGHVGYLPLKAWDSQLPPGGWDLWVTGGTHNGNTYDKPRSGVGQSEFSILSRNPNILLIPSAGAASSPLEADHWVPGDDLQMRIAIFNVGTDTSEVADVDGVGDPRVYAVILRFSKSNNRMEYLESDETTWTALNGNTAYQFPLDEAAGDTEAYTVVIPGASTSNWDNSDLFMVGVAYLNETPYGLQSIVPVLGASNKHSGYSVDAVGLALHGIVSQR